MPVLVALGMLATAAANKADITDLKPQSIEVAARSFSFDQANRARRDFDQLEWRGGLVLSSASPVFGGYSSLALSGDGTQMLAISDAGSWLSADLTVENGRLTGLTAARIGPIPQKDGRPLQKRRHRDAEALAPFSGGSRDGRYFIGFEGFHRLDEYTFEEGEFHGPLRRATLPSNLKRMPSNSGLEGVTFLRGGTYAGALIAFAERKLTQHGDHTGALVKDGKAFPLFAAREGEFDITELAGLKDGSLLMLERSFIPSTLKLDIRLRLIPAEEIEPGARLKGRILLAADNRYFIDNFEAMAVTETKEGETLVTLLSDDNFNFFQNTLLVRFALKRD